MLWYADFVSGDTSDGSSSCYDVADSRLTSTFHSERACNSATPVANKGERCILFLLVTRECFGSIWTYTKNFRTRRLEFRIGHAEPARFDVSARRKSLRKEVNDKVVTLPQV